MIYYGIDFGISQKEIQGSDLVLKRLFAYFYFQIILQYKRQTALKLTLLCFHYRFDPYI